MNYIEYLLIIIITLIIAFAITKSKKKDFRINTNKLVMYLGGIDNILEYEYNKSRFIVNLKDVSKVNKEGIQKMGAQGIVEIENQLKIILGEEAGSLKKHIDELKNKVS
jgi:phosphotransferase system IIB component